MTQLVLSSRNTKKLHEMIELLDGLGLNVTDLTPWPNAPEVEETGTNFLENATLKATQMARFLNLWVVGEDSGLVVPALNGEPGIDSALYAGTHGDTAANSAKLLREMSPYSGAERAGYYISTAVLANPQGEVIASTEGRCHGLIATEYRGTGGFGYDPLFIVPEYGKTFGELPPDVKRQMSHRAKSLGELRRAIAKWVT